MITCDKAAILCHKVQYEEASEAEIAELQHHLAVCDSCAAYTDCNTKLTNLCQKANLQSLSEIDKSEMKKWLNSELQ